MNANMIASLVSLCLCSLAHGQLKQWSPLTIHDKDFDPLSNEMRVKYADVLLSEVEAIYDAIPNLSPDQERWLKNEEERIEKLKDDSKAQGAARIGFSGSKEYRLRYARRSFENMRTVLRSMNQAERANTAIHSWALVACLLTDGDLFLHFEWLTERSVVTLPKRVGILNKGFVAHEIGREILQRIVFENVRKIETSKLASGFALQKQSPLSVRCLAA